MSVIFASKAEVDKEYKTTTKTPTIVKCLGPSQDGKKVRLVVNIPGYGYQPDRPMLVEPSFLLAEISGGEMKTASRKPNVEKLLKKKSIKLSKIPKGKPAPRVKLDNYDLREWYRTRLHENRAQECMEAKEKSCHCRCGGVLHGKSHKAWKDKEEELFANSTTGALSAKQVLELIKHFKK